MNLGETKLVRKTAVPVECDNCEQPAKFMHTYLMENARNNPCSSGYRGDDISWCQDAKKYACAEHKRDVERDAPRGMNFAATFTDGIRFNHLFLKWKEEEIKEQLASEFLKQFQQEVTQ